MRTILLLFNPLLSRRGIRSISRVRQAFEDAGAQVTVEESGANRAGGKKAREAVLSGFDAVIVCGGDGTVFDVLQGLAGSSVPLGIVPFGTGNILAQNLKIPKDPVRAARWLLRSRPASIPLGRITCHDGRERRSWVFAMSAGMGSHATLMKAARPEHKQKTGRAAYFVAGVKLLFSLPIQPFELEITTMANCVLHRQVCEAIALRVAELNFWRPGGGLQFPFLRLATVEGDSALRLARAAVEARFGSGTRGRPQGERSAARYEDVSRIVCRPIPGYRYRMPLSVQADGEVLPGADVEIEMAATSVQMLCAFP